MELVNMSIRSVESPRAAVSPPVSEVSTSESIAVSNDIPQTSPPSSAPVQVDVCPDSVDQLDLGPLFHLIIDEDATKKNQSRECVFRSFIRNHKDLEHYSSNGSGVGVCRVLDRVLNITVCDRPGFQKMLETSWDEAKPLILEAHKKAFKDFLNRQDAEGMAACLTEMSRLARLLSSPLFKVVEEILTELPSIDTLLEKIDAGDDNTRELISGILGRSLKGRWRFDAFLRSCINHIRSGKLDLVPFLEGIHTAFTCKESQEIYGEVMRDLPEDERTALLRVKSLNLKTLPTFLEILPFRDRRNFFESLFRNLLSDLLFTFSGLKQDYIEDIATLFSGDLSCLVSIWAGLKDSTADRQCRACIWIIIQNLDDETRATVAQKFKDLILCDTTCSKETFYHIIEGMLRAIVRCNEYFTSIKGAKFPEGVKFLHLMLQSLRNELGDGEKYIQLFRHESVSYPALLVSVLFCEEQIDSTNVQCLGAILDLSIIKDQNDDSFFHGIGLFQVLALHNGKGRCATEIVEMLSSNNFQRLKSIISRLKLHGEKGMIELLPCILSILNIENVPTLPPSFETRREEGVIYRVWNITRHFFAILGRFFRRFYR